MQSVRVSMFVKTLLVTLVALSVCPSLANAQAAAEGTFTLPFKTRWGKAVLPPGDYEFCIESAGMPGIVRVRREAKGAPVAMIVANGWESGNPSGPNQLVFVNTGEEFAVQSLHLEKLGFVFYFRTPQLKKQTVARVPEPAQRASNSAIGK